MKANYVEPVETKPLLAGAFAGMTEAMDPFSEYIPPDRMEGLHRIPGREAEGLPGARARPGQATLRLPGHRRAHRRQPGRGGGGPEERRPDREDRRPARARPRPVGSGGEAGGEARPARRPSVVRDGKPRRRTLEIVAGSWTPKPPSARPGSRARPSSRFRRSPPGRRRRSRHLLAPFDRTKPLVLDLREQRLGLPTTRRRARRRSSSPPARSASSPARKIETKLFRSEAGERVHDSRLVLLVDSGTAGPAEFFAAAVREALDKTPPKAAEKRAKYERKTLTGRSSGSTKRRRRPRREGDAPLLERKASCGSSASRAWGWRSPSRSSGCRAAARCRSRSGRSGRSPRPGPLAERGSRPTTASTTSRRTKPVNQSPVDPFLERAVKVLAEGRPKAVA